MATLNIFKIFKRVYRMVFTPPCPHFLRRDKAFVYCTHSEGHEGPQHGFNLATSSTVSWKSNNVG